MTIKTFPVAAGAYLNSDPRTFLTHACEINSEGFPISVLCNRVKFDSILEDATQGKDEAPTCKTCARKLAKMK